MPKLPVGCIARRWVLADLQVVLEFLAPDSLAFAQKRLDFPQHLVGIVVDARAVRNRWLSFGINRQTPKVLLRLGDHAWITPFIWGFDTGLVWTTFRVSFCSWILLLLALGGVAPPWAGAVYGLAFVIPLSASLLLSRHYVSALRAVTAVRAQMFGIASMGVLIVLASTSILQLG